MSKRSPRQMLPTLRRFYRFAAPHWKMIVLAFTAMLIYSVTWGGLVLLLKPFTDTMVFMEAEKAGQATREQAQAGRRLGASGAGGTGAPGAGGVQESPASTGEEVESRLLGLEPIRSIREYLRPGPGSLKRIAALVLVLIAPLLLIASFLKTYARRRVGWSVMADLRMAIFSKLTSLSLAFFSKRRTGDLISRLTNDITVSRQAVKFLFGDLIMQPMQLVVMGSIAVWASPELSLLSVVVLPLLIFILRRYGKRIRRYSRKMLERLGELTESISQMLGGIRVVKSFGMEEEENEEFWRRNQKQLRRAFKLVRVRAWSDSLPEFVAALGVGAILIVANYLMEANRLSFPMLTVFVGALLGFTAPVKRLVKSYNVLQESLGAVDRIFDLLDTEARIEDVPDAVELDGVVEGIAFRNVTFAYDDEPVLKGINLYAPKGKVYAIVGETGAGKSTLLDLVPRFYDPQEGRVEIDGIDVSKIRRDSLLKNIAIVGQHPFLFNRTIEENIRYGRRDATDEEVRQAARAANVHEFVKSLPEGYETAVGERGGRLSGGQRQCVTMARAFLKDAPILILDEATSNLDSESERAVQDALRNLTRDRTTFIIAHRLSTVRHADRIIVMKDGGIVEEGTHEELLARGGEYEKLYTLQFAEPDARAAEQT